ncbi:Tripartite motif-containing protein 29 [Anabarilius grahami]|uniref:Tripartite motif-containing protein 29 n=1 Tax=Anabarilius grahami TaxID=495550 RepID=A0A3N0Y1D4_ANAGA|nr:Tripartite motif-containing protein 29 [Anabarilius grahami]
MVEKLKKTRLQATSPALNISTRSGNVQCDSCTGRKQKAVKSCLECRSSYCQNHLEQHENLFNKRHNRMDATGRLQEMICPQHDKMLEIYCRTDQRCICVLCLMDEHKDHDTVSTAEERKEKQRHLEEKERKFQQRIQQKEKDLQQLREAVASHKRSAETAVEDSERIFTELIRSIERRRSEVIQLIRDQERAAVSRAEGLLEQIEQEINDLRRRDAQMKQLLEIDDHFHFLQVLCRESVTGRYYWEVEWCGDRRSGVAIAVAYKTIRRTGESNEILAGCNNQSWRLYCTPTFCSFTHNNIETVLPVVNVSSRIGVYVDHSAGILSFYSVSDIMNLIHRVQTTFTQPLYAAFGFNRNSTVKLCRLTK